MKNCGTNHVSELNVRVSLRIALGHLEVIAEKSLGHDDFDLISSEESTGAGMTAISKRQTALTDADELVQS